MRRTCLDCGAITTGTRCSRCQAAYRAPYHAAEYLHAARSFKGRACEVGLPGCTKVATTVDHVIPKARGGGRGPLRPACAHCNYSLQDRAGRVAHGEGEGSTRVSHGESRDRRPLFAMSTDLGIRGIR